MTLEVIGSWRRQLFPYSSGCAMQFSSVQFGQPEAPFMGWHVSKAFDDPREPHRCGHVHSDLAKCGVILGQLNTQRTCFDSETLAHRQAYVNSCRRILDDAKHQPSLLADPRVATLIRQRLFGKHCATDGQTLDTEPRRLVVRLHSMPTGTCWNSSKKYLRFGSFAM